MSTRYQVFTSWGTVKVRDMCNRFGQTVIESCDYANERFARRAVRIIGDGLDSCAADVVGLAESRAYKAKTMRYYRRMLEHGDYFAGQRARYMLGMTTDADRAVKQS